MNETNKRRSAALGMPMGTANSQLRKILLFDAIRRLGEDICYRCSDKIENIEEFSIEHKKSWLNGDSPKELFFSLDNISFSHIVCNVAAPKLYREGVSPNKGKSSPRKGVPVSLKIVAPEGLLYCTNHQEYLPIKLFHRDSSTGTGYKNICMDCRRVYRQERYKNSLSR